MKYLHMYKGEEEEVQLQHIRNLALEGGGWWTPSSGRSALGKEPSPILLEAGRAPQLVWAAWRKEKSLAPAGIQKPNRPSRSPVAMPTMLQILDPYIS